MMKETGKWSKRMMAPVSSVSLSNPSSLNYLYRFISWKTRNIEREEILGDGKVGYFYIFSIAYIEISKVQWGKGKLGEYNGEF